MADRLTEAQKRRNLLRYFADQNAQQVLPPAPIKNRTRTLSLLNDGLLQVAGVSAMWGDLYALTPAGRRALQSGGDE